MVTVHQAILSLIITRWQSEPVFVQPVLWVILWVCKNKDFCSYLGYPFRYIMLCCVVLWGMIWDALRVFGHPLLSLSSSSHPSGADCYSQRVHEDSQSSRSWDTVEVGLLKTKKHHWDFTARSSCLWLTASGDVHNSQGDLTQTGTEQKQATSTTSASKHRRTSGSSHLSHMSERIWAVTLCLNKT